MAAVQAPQRELAAKAVDQALTPEPPTLCQPRYSLYTFAHVSCQKNENLYAKDLTR